MPPDPNATIEGVTLNLDEQLCLVTLWLGAQFNYLYRFDRYNHAHDKAMRLAADNLITMDLVSKLEDKQYERQDGLNPDGSPLFVTDYPYCLLSGKADAIADQLESKFSLRELIPKP